MGPWVKLVVGGIIWGEEFGGRSVVDESVSGCGRWTYGLGRLEIGMKLQTTIQRVRASDMGYWS